MNPKTQESIKHQSRILNISSLTASQMFNGSYNSNGIWTIPDLINHSDSVEHIFFSILHAEIPNTFYLINSYNNILTISVDSVSTSYTITGGNYNVTTFITMLGTILPASYSVTYNSYTSKFILSNSSLNFTIKGDTSTINRIMGFNTTTDSVSTLTDGVYKLTLPYCFNFIPIPRLNFRSAALQLENYNSYDKSNDVFLSLQNNSQQNSMILFNNNTNLRYHVDVENLVQLDIRITDDFGHYIDFNNQIWYLTIQIDTVFNTPIPKTNFKEITKNNNQNLYKYLEDLTD
jgi:hypothetical protein